MHFQLKFTDSTFGNLQPNFAVCIFIAFGFDHQAHQHNEINQACITFACDTRYKLDWLNAEINIISDHATLAHGSVVTSQLYIIIGEH